MFSKLLFLSLFLVVSLFSKEVKLDVEVSHPVLKANTKVKTYLRVKLTGFDLKKTAKRTAVNVALVLDRSGSMGGEKIIKTKEAAIAFVNRLHADDIISIITYDDRVNVLLPATKISDRQAVIRKIKAIHVGGSTALYAGVAEGAKQLRKFVDKKSVSRIVLLSDGIANVGPSSPNALAQLGTELRKEGFSVTTLGLGDGYNEDLMTQLAIKSDGNHKFLRTNNDIETFFNKELGTLSAIVAKNVSIDIVCSEGIKPLRVLDVEAKIDGQTVHSGFNQIYSKHERYMMLEVEVSTSKVGESKQLAQVSVKYHNMQTNTEAKLTATPTITFAKLNKENKNVMISVTEQLANLQNIQAVRLRDAGRVQEAQEVLKSNSMMLQQSAKKYKSKRLQKQAEENADDMNNLDEKNWNRQRKMMRDSQTKSSSKGAL